MPPKNAGNPSCHFSFLSSTLSKQLGARCKRSVGASVQRLWLITRSRTDRGQSERQIGTAGAEVVAMTGNCGRPIGQPKTGGRKKGTPNRATLGLKETLDTIGCDPLLELAKIAMMSLAHDMSG